MAKTALSLSGDPSIKGVPENYVLPIQDAYLSAGAGFVVIIAGEVSVYNCAF
jgi:formyltetrahydrofolate synthetase